MSDKYWEVVESSVSWSVYQIPFDKCTDEESARSLVDNGDASDYIMDTGADDYQIDSVELKED